MIELITLYASRNGTDVVLKNKDGSFKAIFPNRGYRPTKATKTVTVNCCKFEVKWLDNGKK
jgi:hypothetical protein